MQSLLSYFMLHPWALYIAVGLLSLCIGSFLNVVIYRIPKIMQQEWQQECQLLLQPEQAILDLDKLTLSTPRSSCIQCRTVIPWYYNFPIISWLMLGGKCVHCHSAIGIRYPLIELLTTICGLIVVLVFGASIKMLCGLLLTYILIALTFIDFDHQLLPDRLTLTLAAAGLAINSFSIFTTATLAIWGYITGFLCLWVIYYLFKICTGKEGMGYGDFKLLAALGAWMGPLMLPLIMLLSSCMGALVGLMLIKIRQENRPFAFGPYIAIAGWIALLWGESIMTVYLTI